MIYDGTNLFIEQLIGVKIDTLIDIVIPSDTDKNIDEFSDVELFFFACFLIIIIERGDPL